MSKLFYPNMVDKFIGRRIAFMATVLVGLISVPVVLLACNTDMGWIIVVVIMVVLVVVFSVCWGMAIQKRRLAKKFERILDMTNITLEGNFIGSVSVSFQVNDRAITLSMPTTAVTLAADATPPTNPQDIVLH